MTQALAVVQSSAHRIFGCDDFSRILAGRAGAARKHLPHQVAKKRLVHDRNEIEIRRALPNDLRPRGFPPRLVALRTSQRLALRARRCANWMGSRRAEVWVRVARVFRHRLGVLAARADETVGIGLGPEPVFLPTNLIAPAAYRLPRRLAPRPDRPALARRALVWRALLRAGALASRAALARWQGVSRTRVTQILNGLHSP